MPVSLLFIHTLPALCYGCVYVKAEGRAWKFRLPYRNPTCRFGCRVSGCLFTQKILQPTDTSQAFSLVRPDFAQTPDS